MVRFKNRYLLFELAWRDRRPPEGAAEAALLSALRDAVQLNFGDAGAGAVGPSLAVKFYSPFTGLLVVRCGRAEAGRVRAALALCTRLCGRPVLPRLLRLSGTLKTCRDAALRFDELLAAAAPPPPRHQAAAAAAARAALLALEM